MFDERVFYAFFKEDRIQEAFAYLTKWKDQSFGKAYWILAECVEKGFHFPNVGYDWDDSEPYYQLAAQHGYINYADFRVTKSLSRDELLRTRNYAALGWMYWRNDLQLSRKYFMRAYEEYGCLDSLYESSYGDHEDHWILNALVDSGYFFVFPDYCGVSAFAGHLLKDIPFRLKLIYKYGYTENMETFCSFLRQCGYLVEACRLYANFSKNLYMPSYPSLLLDKSDAVSEAICAYHLCRRFRNCRPSDWTCFPLYKFSHYQRDMRRKAILVLRLAKKRFGRDVATLLARLTWDARHEHPEWHKRYHSDQTIE